MKFAAWEDFSVDQLIQLLNADESSSQALYDVEFVQWLLESGDHIAATHPTLTLDLSLSLWRFGKKIETQSPLLAKDAMIRAEQYLRSAPASTDEILLKQVDLLSQLSQLESQLGDISDALHHTAKALSALSTASVFTASFSHAKATSIAAALQVIEKAKKQNEAPFELSSGVADVLRALAAIDPALYSGHSALTSLELAARYQQDGMNRAALEASGYASRLLTQLSETDEKYLKYLASSYGILSVTRAAAGDLSGSVKASEESLATYQRLAADDPDYLPKVAAALNNLGNRLKEVGTLDRALDSTEHAVLLFRTISKGSQDFLPQLASSLNNLGNRYRELGRYSEALGPSQESVEIFRGLAAKEPAHLPRLASALINLGNRFSDLGMVQQGVEAEREAVDMLRKIVEGSPIHRAQLASAMNNLGTKLGALSQYDESIRLTEEAVLIRRAILAENQATADRMLANSLANLAARYLEAGRLHEANSCAQEAVDMHSDLRNVSRIGLDADLANALHVLANCRDSVGDASEARSLTEEAVKLRRLLAVKFGRLRPQLASSLMELGLRHAETGNGDTASSLLDEAEVIYREELQRGGVLSVESTLGLLKVSAVAQNADAFGNAADSFRRVLKTYQALLANGAIPAPAPSGYDL